MSCKYNYKGTEYTKEELIGVLSNDNALLEKYRPQESRMKYTEEELDVFNEKIEHLQKTMNVKVIMDDSVSSSRVLSSTDPRTIKAGKPVILINPSQLFDTTAIHEFAHIFIDSLERGSDNPRLKKAFNELKDTPLFDEVKALYPELNDEMFMKELIVTAMGMEGSKIWDNEIKASAWQAFKNWFIKSVKSVFGIKESEIQSLTQELLSNSVKSDIKSNLSKYDQEARFVKEVKDEEVDIDQTYQEILTSIKNLYSLREPKSAKDRKYEVDEAAKQKQTLFSSVKDINDQLESFNKTDMLKGLFAYLKWSDKELSKLNKSIDKIQDGGNMSEDDFAKFKQYNESYQLISDVEKIIAKETANGNISVKKEEVLSRAIALTKSKYTKVNNKLLHAARLRYADIMTEHSNEHITEWRNEYIKRYKAIEPQESLDEWVTAKMNENMDFIKDQARIEYMKRAEKSMGDISKFAKILFTEKNQDSEDIQIASMLMDRADFNTSKFTLSEASKFKNHLDSFSNRNSGKTAESKYNRFIKSTKKGAYLLSEYDPGFLEAVDERNETILNSDYQKENYKDLERTKTGFKLNDKNYEFHFSKNIKNIEVNGEFVKYSVKNKTIEIPFHEAVSWHLDNLWKKENLKQDGFNKNTPSDKWLDRDYERMMSNEKDMKDLEYFKDSINRAEELYDGKNSLIRKSYEQSFYRLPAVRKNSLIEAFKGNLKFSIKETFLGMFMKNSDDYDMSSSGEGNNKKNPARVVANVNNEEQFEIPIPYRANLDASEQSLDLHTILFLNIEAAKNYSEKSIVENKIDVIIHVAENRSTSNTGEFDKKAKMHAFNKDDDSELLLPKGSETNEVFKLKSMKENRIFGITSRGNNTVGGANVHKVVSTTLKYASRTALIGNWINSLVNATTGTVNNIIEAIGGDVYNLKDWSVAKRKYWSDIKGISGDMGSNIHTSKTNMFLNVFNVLGSREMLMNNFEENTKIQTLFKEHSLRPFANAGEHMMQAQVMYAVMNNIKALDSQGKYLNSKGVVVKDKKDAASLDELVTFEKNKETGSIEMKLPEFLKATTFTQIGGHDNILLETRNLIKKKIIDLHGNYNTDLQSAAQREWWGKMAFFLRKWIESTTLRRWRGLPDLLKSSEELSTMNRFYSQDTKSYEEGYYSTAVRFVYHGFFKGLKEQNYNVIRAYSEGISNLSPKERANIRKFMAEMGMITLTFMAYTAMGGFDDDPEEETLVARYVLRRQLSELSFYSNPLEALKIASSPSASLNFTERVFKAMNQMFSPTERYEQGKNKGELKLWIKTAKILPGFSQYYKDIEASLRFLSVGE